MPTCTGKVESFNRVAVVVTKYVLITTTKIRYRQRREKAPKHQFLLKLS